MPRLIRLKYLTEINPVNDAARLGSAARRDRRLVEPELALAGTLADYGVVGIASVLFNDRFGSWGFLDLWRSGGSARFDPADAAFLAGIVEPVTAARRRRQADTFVARPAVETRRVGPVVLLLSPDIKVLEQTHETQEYLRILVPPAEEQSPIPASTYNVAARMFLSEHTPGPSQIDLHEDLRAQSPGTPGPRPRRMTVNAIAASRYRRRRRGRRRRR